MLNLPNFLRRKPKSVDDEIDVQASYGRIEPFKVPMLELYSQLPFWLLYNVYCIKKITKSLCKSLNRKYKTEDSEAKKFIVGKFLNYKMVDSRTMINQVHE